MAEEFGLLESILGEEVMTPKQVCIFLGISRSTLHNKVKADDTFPKPISITKGKPRWKYNDVHQWLSRKMSGEL
jgi:predicted DNA-binding transcriptional regulator AlpA